MTLDCREQKQTKVTFSIGVYGPFSNPLLKITLIVKGKIYYFTKNKLLDFYFGAHKSEIEKNSAGHNHLTWRQISSSQALKNFSYSQISFLNEMFEIDLGTNGC